MPTEDLTEVIRLARLSDIAAFIWLTDAKKSSHNISRTETFIE